MYTQQQQCQKRIIMCTPYVVRLRSRNRVHIAPSPHLTLQRFKIRFVAVPLLQIIIIYYFTLTYYYYCC